jgi:hypothetical protein
VDKKQFDKFSLSGRTSREKSIDVLIFGNGHVLHHPPAKF